MRKVYRRLLVRKIGATQERGRTSHGHTPESALFASPHPCIEQTRAADGENGQVSSMGIALTFDDPGFAPERTDTATQHGNDNASALYQATKSSSYRWYVVETKWRREEPAATALGAKEIETYAPKLLSWTSHGKGGQVSLMFPGLVLARLDLREDYADIIRESNIKSFMTFGGEPVVITDEAVEFLKSCERPDGLIRCGVSRHEVSEDQIDPTFSPLVDLVERYAPTKERLRVLASVLRAEICPAGLTTPEKE